MTKKPCTQLTLDQNKTHSKTGAYNFSTLNGLNMQLTALITLLILSLTTSNNIHGAYKKNIEIIATTTNDLPHIINRNNRNFSTIVKKEVVNLSHLAIGGSLLAFGTLALTESLSTAYYELTETGKTNENLYTGIINGLEVLPVSIAGVLLTCVGYKELIKSGWPKRTSNSLRTALKKLI